MKVWYTWSLRKMCYKPNERAFPHTVDVHKGNYDTYIFAKLPFQSLVCRHWKFKPSQNQARNRLCFSWWCQVITGADEKHSRQLFLASLKMRSGIFQNRAVLEMGRNWFHITQKVSLDNSSISSWPCSLKIYNTPHGKGCTTRGERLWCNRI